MDDKKSDGNDDFDDDFGNDNYDNNQQAKSQIEPKKKITINHESREKLADEFEDSNDNRYKDDFDESKNVDNTFRNEKVEDNFEDDFDDPSPKKQQVSNKNGGTKEEFDEDFDNDDFDNQSFEESQNGTVTKKTVTKKSKKSDGFDFADGKGTEQNLDDGFFDNFKDDNAMKKPKGKRSSGTSPLMQPKKKSVANAKPPSRDVTKPKPKAKSPSYSRQNSEKSRSRSKSKPPQKPPTGKAQKDARRDSNVSQKNFRINSRQNIDKSRQNIDKNRDNTSRVGSARSQSKRSTSYSRKAGAKVPNLFDLMKANKDLHQEQKNMNQKLSRMIDVKGFTKLQSKLREGKKTWKDRPTSAKCVTLNREIDNSKKQAQIKKDELQKLLDKRGKIINPIYMTDLNKEILNFHKMIKLIKKEVHDLDIQSQIKAKKAVVIQSDERARDTYNEISEQLRDIDVWNNKNLELKSGMEHSMDLKEKQDRMVGELEDKINEICNDANDQGYVEDNTLIVKYKDLETKINKLMQHNRLLESKWEVTYNAKEKEWVDYSIRTEKKMDDVVEKEEYLKNQRGDLIELIEIAKQNQKPHVLELLDKIRNGISTPPTRSQQ